MSRTLEKAIESRVRQQDCQRAFEAISQALKPNGGELSEFEILGGHHILDDDNALFLQDGNAIALTKLGLVQAFIIARRLLFDHPNAELHEDTKVVQDATAMMLLMDPEHLTAANTRKRILQTSLGVRLTGRESLLLTEKHFIDSLLTSRLHRHTKSPTLWSHRQWLITQFQRYAFSVDTVDDFKRVILVSGARHPRNYYAWTHARFLVSQLEDVPDVLDVLVNSTKDWCFSHHDDISGWMFLSDLLSMHMRRVPEVVAETLKFTKSFQWRNESVWYFLRSVVARDGGRPEQECVQDIANALRAGAKANALHESTNKAVNQALRWMNKHVS